MIVTRCELARLRVPLKTPFKTALRTVEQVDDVVVLLHTDTGHVGHGSAAATAAITGDTHGSIIDAIRLYIAPRLIGCAIADLNRSTALVQAALHGNTSAKAAVDMALHDLWGQLHQAPLYRLLGGGTPQLQTDITISANDVDTMVRDALHAVEQGHVALKIKLGKDAAHDVARVQAIHGAVAGRATLRLDANQGWSAKQTVHWLRTLEAAGIMPELIEQPVPARDWAGLRHIAEQVNTPVLADESVFGPRDAIALLQQHGADMLNIKLMKSGGIGAALQLADIAALHGVPCMMGCMLESSIGVTAAAHVAIARADTIRCIDLDGPSLCRYDPVDGAAHFDGPHIRINDAPGLGIRSIRGLEPIAD